MITNKDILAITGNMFYDKRTELGLTQEKMAENLRITTRQYQYLEYGEKCCSLETFSNFAESFEIDVMKYLSDISRVSKTAKE